MAMTNASAKFGARSAALQLVALVLACLLTANVANAQQSPRARAIEMKIMCMCGGCNESVAECKHMGGSFSGPCDTAKAMMKEVDERIARGESNEMILQDFVQEYGPTVLLSPPAKGFDLWAWVMPVLAPLVGILLVWILVMRWRKRDTIATAGAVKVSPELLARARKEMAGGDDE
jgi:cytochrome c-type biogenesis protein CcmH